VRESQIAQFVYLGQFGDTFNPGKHSLVTDNIPIPSTLKGWKYGFESPFKADVYFARTFKHILVPVWLVSYTFGSSSFQTVVNGYTGETAGDRPISWVKVFFYVILPALIVLIIVAISQSMNG
jgi:hypothetical protein